MHAYTHARTDGRTEGWMDRWMDGCWRDLAYAPFLHAAFVLPAVDVCKLVVLQPFFRKVSGNIVWGARSVLDWCTAVCDVEIALAWGEFNPVYCRHAQGFVLGFRVWRME